MWPSTLKYPKLAFSFELLRWLNGMLMEGHVSIKTFCECLKARSSKHSRPYISHQIQNIYKSLITECFEEFKFFLYKSEHPLDDDGTECPACFQASRKFFSFDADFQLVRKASGGRQWNEPKHKGHFFLNQIEVDDFIDNYQNDKEKQKHGNQEMLDKLIMSIPIFHAYGHKTPCQILYSPRRIDGVELTDGESVERLWSYLGFNKVTKESTPENRIDTLVDGLIYYGDMLREKLDGMVSIKIC